MSFHRSFASALAAFLILSSFSLAEETVAIEGRIQFPDDTPFNVTTRVLLNQGQQSTYSTSDGRFSFFRVPPGTHFIDAYDNTHHFSQIQITMSPASEPLCVEYAYAGATKIPKQCPPVVLTALGKYEYFEKRSGFSIFGFLRNPMILLMVLSGGMMFLMPKMMENMDPEEKALMKKQMAMQRDPSTMLSSLWGELSGGGSSNGNGGQQQAKKSIQK